MNWIEISITTTQEGIDAISEVFSQAGVNGVLIEDPQDVNHVLKEQETQWCYIDESLKKEQEGRVIVKGYLAENSSSATSIGLMKERLNWLLDQDLGMDIGQGKMETSKVKEEDWANNWKYYFKPQPIGERVVIKPTWEDYDEEEGQVIVELSPGMAFGTGTHETTILCVEAVEKHIKSGDCLLDIGCGTGILTITGLLLGARQATAVDLDLDAVRIAKENADRNQVLHKANIMHGDLMEDVSGSFNVVVANIIADAIIEISKNVKEYLTDDGIFIASGIILDRIEDVEAALEEEGLSILEVKTMGGWAAVVSSYE